MELYQARYFLAVAEECSFTRAAQRCGVSQPSLSNGIKRLETELGAILFHRQGGTVSLSKLGLAVKPYIEKFYGQACELDQQLQQLKQTVERQVQARTGAADGELDAFRAPAAPSRSHRRNGDLGGDIFRKIDTLIERTDDEPITVAER